MATPLASDPIFFGALIGARFILPLFIPIFPLPAIVGCLLVDAADQSILALFTHVEPATYQAYDKALDIFYLSIAAFAVLRNWNRFGAAQVARFLFYVRLVGVLWFELTGWRPLLLVFPNAFEFYFIFYEALRSRWAVTRFSTRFFIASAAVIWLIKLPQEYWIHVARLDVTDVLKQRALGAEASVGWREAIAGHVIAFAVLIGAGVALVLLVRAGLRRVAPRPTHELVLRAPPLPKQIDEAHERDRSIAKKWRLLDYHWLEKTVLVGCVTVIFAQIVPGVDASSLQLVRGVAIVVTMNTFIRLRAAQSGWSRETLLASFALLLVINASFLVFAEKVLRRSEGSIYVPSTLFFLLLLTLIVAMYDHWRPVFDVRFATQRRRGRFARMLG
ncbi:MAG TPA: hypothetical protein VFU38_08400 [Candidatus Krumholzibacteria bacterium]|nr:hypothetical protein [Candidatus Krumholzibacteria bacterium]